MDVDEGCIDILEAILARGINDVTSWGWVQAIFFLVYGTLMIMGLIGNGGVLFAVLNNRRLRSARNIFLLNLILADILLCLTAIPVTPWYGITKDWQFGSLMCRLMPLSNSCSVFVTSWSLTAIAIDKFIHIIDPTRASVSVRKATLLTLFIWLICSLINVPYLMSYELVDGSFYVNGNQTPFCGRFCDEINWHGDTPRQLYGSAVMLLQFVVPLTIITYCYSRILQKVASDMIVHNSQFCASLSIAQRLEASNRKKRVPHLRLIENCLTAVRQSTLYDHSVVLRL
ncbi:hypothetical protein AB6A40_005199 [Gnathostoma spinigerum]|uniref:G-protein coupled receptors family 1 profile domain-containing protein n=1 Tax=Gnathostoma spinigerum TaxID=75299 RepID=A0ABD6EFV8_9BILA